MKQYLLIFALAVSCFAQQADIRRAGATAATNITGTLSVTNGGTGTGTAFTLGSVVFAGPSGVYAQDNPNFFWDDTNNRLGIGNAAPLVKLNVTSTTTQQRLSYDLTHYADSTVDSSGNILFAPSGLVSSFAGGVSLSPTTSSTTGIIFKGVTRFIHNYGDATSDGQNLFIGLNSGNFTMSPSGGAASLASYNTGIGNSTLGALTTGFQNIAIATSALASVTSGKENIGIGYATMVSNTTGNRNTGVGTVSLVNVDGGSANTAIGYNTGGGITTGSRNTIIGALVSGLASGLTDNIILANGGGTIKAQHDGSNWTFTGGASVTGSLSVGGGTAIAKFIKATATLDFGNTSAQTSADLTITATGAAVGDTVVLATPASIDANSCYTARVSAADTVTVRFNNYSALAIDPASGSFTVRVIHE